MRIYPTRKHYNPAPGSAGAANITRQYFSGNGVTTVFTISSPGEIIIVEYGGQIMREGIDYNIAGQNVTFTFAPDAPDGGDSNNIGITFMN